jgi:hypothetical protein
MVKDGKVVMNVWGVSTADEVATVTNAFRGAGFKDVQVVGNGSVIVLAKAPRTCRSCGSARVPE